MEDAEDRPKEDETPLMRFLKANRELLQTSVGSEQEQPQQLGETTTAPSKSNASQQQLEEGENGDKTSLMTSNLHLLAEIATRESPSPEQPTDEHMASTSTLSDRQTTTARPLPPPGLHLLPLSVLTGRGSRPVGPIREEARTSQPAVPHPAAVEQPAAASGGGLVLGAGTQLAALDLRAPVLLAKDGGQRLVLGRPDLLYTVQGAAAATAILYPMATTGPPLAAAQTATLFSLGGLQPIMSVSESRRPVAEDAASNATAAVPTSGLQESTPLPRSLESTKEQSRDQTASSSSASSSSSRESSPKSSSDSQPSLLEAGRRRVRCAHCGRICSTLAHLNNHIRSVHSNQRLHYPKTMQCGHCSKMFGRNSHLVEHVRTVHEGRKRVYQRAQCKDCGKEFARQCSLNQHLSTSHGKQFSK
jgi:hypothetical protein